MPRLAVHLAHSMYSHVLLVIMHKPGKLVGTLQACAVPRFTGKTRVTGKTAEILERLKNNGETLIDALIYISKSGHYRIKT